MLGLASSTIEFNGISASDAEDLLAVIWPVLEGHALTTPLLDVRAANGSTTDVTITFQSAGDRAFALANLDMQDVPWTCAVLPTSAELREQARLSLEASRGSLHPAAKRRLLASAVVLAEVADVIERREQGEESGGRAASGAVRVLITAVETVRLERVIEIPRERYAKYQEMVERRADYVEFTLMFGDLLRESRDAADSLGLESLKIIPVLKE
jgi:hypothetical protein